jgi:hypothetical protein
MGACAERNASPKSRSVVIVWGMFCMFSTSSHVLFLPLIDRRPCVKLNGRRQLEGDAFLLVANSKTKVPVVARFQFKFTSSAYSRSFLSPIYDSLRIHTQHQPIEQLVMTWTTSNFEIWVSIMDCQLSVTMMMSSNFIVKTITSIFYIQKNVTLNACQ